MIDFLEEQPLNEKNYTTQIMKSGDVVKIDKQSLVIVCDLSKDEYPVTASGKSLSVASSHGSDPVGGTLKLSLNLNSKLPS